MPTTVIPPTWDTSMDSSSNLRRLLIAQSIGFSAHKSQLARLMETVTPIQTVNGVEVYTPYINGLQYSLADLNSDESQFMRLMLGMTDSQITEVSTAGTDVIQFNWRRRNAFEKIDWNNALNLLQTTLTDVTRVKLYSTMISIWKDKLKPNPDYVAGYWTDDDPPVWVPPVGEEFIPIEAIDRQPLPIQYHSPTPKDIDKYREGSINPAFEKRVIVTGFPKEYDIYRYKTFEMFDEYQVSIQLFNSLGTDITANYNSTTLLALTSMLITNGTNFMAETASLYKTGETLDSLDESYFVHGAQEYSGTILQSFIDDVGDTYLDQYTYLDTDSQRFFPKDGESEWGSVYSYLFGAYLWTFRDEEFIPDDIEELTGGMFMKYGEWVYLKVDEFKKCSADEYGQHIFALAYINAYNESSGFLGLGGFLGDLLNGIVAVIGGLLAGIVNVFAQIIILALKVTGQYYLMLKMGISEDDIDLSAQIAGTIILTILTWGYYSAYQVGVQASIATGATATTATVAGTTAVSTTTVGQAFSSGIAYSTSGGAMSTAMRLGGQALSVASKVKGELDNREMVENRTEHQQRIEALKELEELHTDYSGEQSEKSISGDRREQERQLMFNPFARMDAKRMLRYDSMKSFKNRNSGLNKFK